MNDTWPKVAIIILNWNGWRDTIECLESVEQLTYTNYEVVVVDNGSVDNSVEHIKHWALGQRALLGGEPEDKVDAINLPTGPARVMLRGPRFALLCSEDNLGFSGGCNLGIEYALTKEPDIDFIFLLNNDARVEPDSLTRCMQIAKSENASIAGFIVKTLDGTRIVGAGAKFPFDELFKSTNRAYYLTPTEYYSVDAVSGAAMLIRSDLLRHRKNVTGYYFDPALFLYCEELELCLWARRYGYKVIMVKTAVVYHKIGSSSGGSGSPLAYYYITRNRIRVASAYLPWWLKVAFHFWYLPSRIIRVLQRQLEGKSEVARAILEGLLDGYRGTSGKWTRHYG